MKEPRLHECQINLLKNKIEKKGEIKNTSTFNCQHSFNSGISVGDASKEYSAGKERMIENREEEEEIEMIIPEFGTCGIGTNDDVEEEAEEKKADSGCAKKENGECPCKEQKLEETKEQIG